MRVELAYADPFREILVAFEMRPGATVGDCVEGSGLFRLEPELRGSLLGYAVFGRRVELTDSVSNGDRIEVLRPLEVDPKEARRLRAHRAARPRPDADWERGAFRR